MTTFITIPGIYGSGPAHWQTQWEASERAFNRFRPESWDEPRLHDWVDALERAAAARPGAVLVAHSLGCLLVAHWASRSAADIGGAFLVSVPDPSGPDFPEQASSFRDVPVGSLRFPVLVVSSSNDRYGALEYQQATAASWGASVISIGTHGHVNGASGLGSWQQGRDLLTAFVAGLQQTAGSAP